MQNSVLLVFFWLLACCCCCRRLRSKTQCGSLTVCSDDGGARPLYSSKIQFKFQPVPVRFQTSKFKLAFPPPPMLLLLLPALPRHESPNVLQTPISCNSRQCHRRSPLLTGTVAIFAPSALQVYKKNHGVASGSNHTCPPLSSRQLTTANPACPMRARACR
jgi:hypothetical protein